MAQECQGGFLKCQEISPTTGQGVCIATFLNSSRYTQDPSKQSNRGLSISQKSDRPPFKPNG
jgi:hypothetical protein